jgi:hypothetical protein
MTAVRALGLAILFCGAVGGCTSAYGFDPGWQGSGEGYGGSGAAAEGLVVIALAIPALALYAILKILSQPAPWDTD